MQKEDDRALLVVHICVQQFAGEHALAYSHEPVGIVVGLQGVYPRATAEQGDEQYCQQEQTEWSLKAFHLLYCSGDDA